MHFWQPAKTVLPEAAKKSLDARKWKEKQDFYQNNKKILAHIVTLDTYNNVFETTLFKYATNCQKFFCSL